MRENFPRVESSREFWKSDVCRLASLHTNPFPFGLKTMESWRVPENSWSGETCGCENGATAGNSMFKF